MPEVHIYWMEYITWHRFLGWNFPSRQRRIVQCHFDDNTMTSHELFVVRKHWHPDCLFTYLFKLTSKKISKLHITGRLWGETSGERCLTKTSNAKIVISQLIISGISFTDISCRMPEFNIKMRFDAPLFAFYFAVGETTFWHAFKEYLSLKKCVNAQAQ